MDGVDAVESGGDAGQAAELPAHLRVRRALHEILAAGAAQVVVEAAALPAGILQCLEQIVEALREEASLTKSAPTLDVLSVPAEGAEDVTEKDGDSKAVWQNLDREGNPIDWSSHSQLCSVCGKEKPASDFSRKELKKLRRRGLDTDAKCSACVQFCRAHLLEANGKNPVGRGISQVQGMKNNLGLPDHLDKVFAKSCFSRLAELRLFPGAKDVSEAYGALQAVWQHFPAAAVDADVLCLSIGDGATPRAAGLAAFLTRWRCVAVDPGLRPEWTGEVE
eukprot:TRINITY_DN18053_c1_g1_i4.p1 TRINITY_DN18053_c1_g1~~TRINITY_DN18053_c1_g1_i4.p1  ORF type:complete len:278 (+),score=56.22 TRINITY_DN18053_c1_g1_i4:67-900(+)